MNNQADVNLPESDVAIIGMAGRFPGAKNIDEFWENLVCGVESVSYFSEEELRASGVPTTVLENPNYVRAKAVLEDVEMFDASFFGFSPREAEILDPQQRLLLECAWEAMETAGYSNESSGKRVGVFAGSSLNTYLLNLYRNREFVEAIGPFQILIASDKDFLASRISYKLNLTGPSISVQTACSTSLVAVHLACQSLLNGECDMALAGGVSIKIPQKSGYVYQEGSFLSPDGHCRAFDAEAKGTVTGDGAGVVLLKRLEDALADRDNILAIIKGSAINNDGARKAGFTAPNVEAQAEVIAEAQAMARVSAETITYIEAHGTGTTLGDPIEIAALTEAFRATTESKRYCAVGSVKTNIGHLDAASGVAGLIKAVMALSKRKLPPSLHFKEPNPEIDFRNSPFYVNKELQDWTPSGFPRRAGVSSFGIGGTNVHVILEEPPMIEPAGAHKPWHLITLSARTLTALETATSNIAQSLGSREAPDLADVAYSLQTGRKAFEKRRVLVCRDKADASDALERLDPRRVLTSTYEGSDRDVAFMFPGQGAQYLNMGRELYGVEREFRNRVAICSQIVESILGLDLRDLLYPETLHKTEVGQELARPSIAQPALFVIEYALAGLWLEWGLRPQVMIGHSAGEYVAACLAGVFSLEDALRLICARGRLIEQLPAGAMLAVWLDEGATRRMTGSELSIAADNGPSLCTVSGTVRAVEEFESRLLEKGVRSRRLSSSRAYHSHLMDPILRPFIKEVEKIGLSAPMIPYISNLTGTWIKADEATDPEYWAAHLRRPVRFREGLSELIKGFDGLLLEVGPGDSLSSIARRQPERRAAQSVINTLRHSNAPISDHAFLLTSLGKLWLAGVRIDWSRMHAGEKRLRVPLPAYPFERKRYWVDINSHIIDTGRQETAAVVRPEYARPALAGEYQEPGNELEETLARIWQDLLGTERIGVFDDFFSLGGHSLLATQLVSRLNEEFDVLLPLHRLFESPTIAGLAEIVEELLLEKIEALTETEVEVLMHMDAPPVV